MIPLGRYQLHSPIGSGGSSTVYLAKDTELDREVAIKCFDIEGLDSNLIQRLRNEAVVLAQLNHPNIVQMYDVVEDEKTLGLVMEFARGATLAAKLKERIPEQKQALGWLIQIAEGLNKAHQSGIIHCDLKLENVIVTVDGTVKIADFGIAKAKRDNAAEDGQTNGPGLVSGSYFSLSPEQARGENVDFRTDVFSFGILSYQLLTGRHPFGSSKDPKVIAQRIVNERFEFASSDSQTIPQTIMQLLSVLLEKRPEDRPANIAIVASALKQTLEDNIDYNPTYEDATVAFEAIKPQKVSLWSRTWFKRTLAGSVLVVLTVAVFLAWPKKVPEVQYVAMLEPDVTAVDGFSDKQRRQISVTIKNALQEGLLSAPYFSLIARTDSEAFDEDVAGFAQAVAADIVLQIQAECSPEQCQMNLRKLVADDWQVAKQRTWPVLANSFEDVRATTVSEFGELFELDDIGFASVSVNDDFYQRYLKIYLDTAAGSNVNNEYLDELESLHDSSNLYLPFYELFLASAWHLYLETGDDNYFKRVERLFRQTPTRVSETVLFQKLEFDLSIKKGDHKKAESILMDFEKSGADRVLINDLHIELASKRGDYESAVSLERKNVVLRPSYIRHYNLAVSELTLGNLELALEAAETAQALAPNDSYTKNLLAGIELASGNIEKAIAAYRALVDSNPDTYNMSNLGLSLMLKRSYSEAIEYQLKVLKVNSHDISSMLNLADSYNLEGNEVAALSWYNQVLQLTKGLNDPVSYHVLAQAEAHLGLYNDAIKTLQKAEKIAPETPELAYSSAIVHSLSGNNNAAIVEVEKAISLGMGKVWFRLKWFDNLCAYPLFIELVGTEKNKKCQFD